MFEFDRKISEETAIELFDKGYPFTEEEIIYGPWNLLYQNRYWIIPSVYEVREWLEQEKNIYVSVVHNEEDCYDCYVDDGIDEVYANKNFTHRIDAIIEGVKQGLKLLKK